MQFLVSDKSELHASGSRGKTIYARIWRGQTSYDKADTYGPYLYEYGVLKIRGLPGNLGVQMFREERDGLVEFSVTSYWPSLEAIAVWSGADLTRTRHLARDPEFLLNLPEHVTLVEVVANDWLLPEGSE